MLRDVRSPHLRAFAEEDRRECERILRALPEWFGIESANAAYIEACGRMPTWIAEREGNVVGFVIIREHNPRAAEIECLAVQPDLHRAGVGRELVAHVESLLDAEYLQVKTLGPSMQYEPYERTRAFYEALGFVPLEEHPKGTLWETDPALVMVKKL